MAYSSSKMRSLNSWYLRIWKCLLQDSAQFLPTMFLNSKIWSKFSSPFLGLHLIRLCEINSVKINKFKDKKILKHVNSASPMHMEKSHIWLPLDWYGWMQNNHKKPKKVLKITTTWKMCTTYIRFHYRKNNIWPRKRELMFYNNLLSHLSQETWRTEAHNNCVGVGQIYKRSKTKYIQTKKKC